MKLPVKFLSVILIQRPVTQCLGRIFNMYVGYSNDLGRIFNMSFGYSNDLGRIFNM